VKVPGFNPWKLKCDLLVPSKFCFKFILYRYSVVDAVVRRLEGEEDGEGRGGVSGGGGCYGQTVRGGDGGEDTRRLVWGPNLRRTEWLLRNPNGLCRFWSPPDEDQWISVDRRQSAHDMYRRLHEGWTPTSTSTTSTASEVTMDTAAAAPSSQPTAGGGTLTTQPPCPPDITASSPSPSPSPSQTHDTRSTTAPTTTSSPWFREPKVSRLKEEWDWARTRLDTEGLGRRLKTAAAARGGRPWRIAIGGIALEANRFAPPTVLEDFAIRRGKEVVRWARQTTAEVNFVVGAVQAESS
jgi:hypothetical protein